MCAESNTLPVCAQQRLLLARAVCVDVGNVHYISLDIVSAFQLLAYPPIFSDVAIWCIVADMYI